MKFDISCVSQSVDSLSAFDAVKTAAVRAIVPCGAAS